MYKTFVQLENEWGKRASGDTSRWEPTGVLQSRTPGSGEGEAPSSAARSDAGRCGRCGFVEDRHFFNTDAL